MLSEIKTGKLPISISDVRSLVASCLILTRNLYQHPCRVYQREYVINGCIYYKDDCNVYGKNQLPSTQKAIQDSYKQKINTIKVTVSNKQTVMINNHDNESNTIVNPKDIAYYK